VSRSRKEERSARGIERADAESGAPGATGRRGFLRALGITVGGTLVLPHALGGCAPGDADQGGADTAPASTSASDTARTGAAQARALGVQLYTVRTLMQKDVEGTLKAVAGIGYREVELAGLHGKSARDFRALLDGAGLTAPASHISLAEVRANLQRVLDDAATLGNRWVVVPYLDESERTADGYRRLAATLNEAGARARRTGLRIAYHNHEFEFAPVGDTTGYDILLGETDPEAVEMELDLFWATKGGRDPIQLFERHPRRFPLVHVKDMTREGAMVAVGAGSIDFQRIFARASQAGIRHYFVEHDEPADPLESIRASHTHLSRMAW
jgi:sugar phosphate isomerase/epimerase